MAAAKKFTFPQLALMDWLCETPGQRVFVSPGYGPNREIWFWALGETGEDGKRDARLVLPWRGTHDKEEGLDLQRRLGGGATLDFHRLYTSGYISSGHLARSGERHADFLSTFRDKHQFGRNGSLVRLTRQGLEWFNSEGRAQFEAEVERRAEAERAVSRIVLIGAASVVAPDMSEQARRAQELGVKLPDLSRKLVRPYAYARVVKETASRLYVEDVKPVEISNDGRHRRTPVQGTPPNLYVSPADLIADGISLVGVSRYVEADNEYASDVARIGAEVIAKVLPALIDADLRLKQKLGERTEMLAELLETLGATPPKRDGDEAPATGPKR